VCQDSGQSIGHGIQDQDARFLSDRERYHPEREIDNTVSLTNQAGSPKVDLYASLVQPYTRHGLPMPHRFLKSADHLDNGAHLGHFRTIKKEEL
jgi:hypothetical protein